MNAGCSTFEITPVADVDIAAITVLAGDIWRQHYPGIISHEQIEYMLARMYAPTMIRDEIARGMHWVKASADGALAGFASFGPVDDGAAMKLHKLYLLERVRGRGYGGALLRHVEAVARAAGMRRLMLAVNKRNTGSIAVYRKHGFVIDHAVVADIGGGYVMDDYVMAKAL